MNDKCDCGETLDIYGLCPCCDETCIICERQQIVSIATTTCDVCDNDICDNHVVVMSDGTVWCYECIIKQLGGMK